MGPTRQTILDLLKRRGQATARELAQVLNVTAPAVRQHLTALERDGVVAASPVKRPMGRPVRVYILAPASAPHFPTAYGPLALDLLRLVKKSGGAKAVEKLLAKRRKHLLTSYRKRVKTAKGSKLEILAQIRDEEGYVAEVSPSREAGQGDAQLVEHHCPIRGVADEFPEVCRQEQLLFEEVLGRKVQRVEHMVEGGLRCRYVFAQPGKAVAKRSQKRATKKSPTRKKAVKKRPTKKKAAKKRPAKKKAAKKRPAKRSAPRKAKAALTKAKKRPAKKKPAKRR